MTNVFIDLLIMTQKRIALRTIHLILLIIGPLVAYSQFGKGIPYLAQDSSFSTKFNLRFQTLYVFQYDESTNESSSQILIRRARLKFGGFAFSPRLKYKVELGLSNRDLSIDKEDGNGRGASRVILDAVLMWNFAKNWTLWLGQTKLPSNRERVISSGDLQFVDRSVLNSRFTLDRDVGIQLRGDYTIGKTTFKPMLAISQGEGRNITSENFGGYDYTLHLDLLPFGEFSGSKGDYVASDLQREDSPKLSIGLTYDYNDGAVRQGGQLGNFVRNGEGVYLENSLQSFFADFMFKYQGLSIMSEFADKKAAKNLSNTSNKYNTGYGFNFQVGYLLVKNFETALRYTMVRRDESFSGIKDENQLTLGLSKYIVGHKLKVQGDLSRLSFPSQDEGTLQFRIQAEMQF